MITFDTNIDSLELNEDDIGFKAIFEVTLKGFKSITDVDRYLYNLEILNYITTKRILLIHTHRAEINKLFESNI